MVRGYQPRLNPAHLPTAGGDGNNLANRYDRFLEEPRLPGDARVGSNTVDSDAVNQQRLEYRDKKFGNQPFFYVCVFPENCYIFTSFLRWWFVSW